MLPFTFLCYILSMHENNRLRFHKENAVIGLPTLVLIGVILTNPFTGKLFCFDPSRGYVKGPWYLLMYYSAILHLAVALFLIIIWRKKLGFQRVKVLLEILVISGGGVIIQLFEPVPF